MTWTRGGHNFPYPNSKPELPEPDPDIPDYYFGYEVEKPEINLGNSGNNPRYPNSQIVQTLLKA